MGAVATRQIVIELCKETGDPQLLNSQTIWGYVFDAIRDLNLHNMPTWETAKGLCLNDYNAIDWPCNLVGKPLITFIMRDGRALALDVDEDILSTADTDVNDFDAADREIQDFFRIDGFSSYFRSYNWGLGELYGFGSGYRHLGLVTHKKSTRQSFIKGCHIKSTDTFGMFFKSDGLSPDSAQYVPAECKEAIEFFALSKWFRTRNPSLGRENRANYKEEFTRLAKFNDNATERQWLEALKSNDKSSPKF